MDSVRLPRSILLACLLGGCSFPYEVGTTTDAAAGGSCADLPPGSVLSCGTCGRVPCVDGKYAGCVEPETAPGGKCGTCGTATYACKAPGTVECSKADDRTAGSDLPLTTTATSELDKSVVNRRTQLAASYVAKHNGEITGVRWMLRRTTYTPCGHTATTPHPDPACGNCVPDSTIGGFNCSLVAPVTPGTIQLQILRGAPGATKTDEPPLATVELDPMSLPDPTSADLDALVEFVPKTPVAVKAGDTLTFALGTDSTSTAMIATVARDKLSPELMAEPRTWTRSVYPSGAWSSLARGQAVIEVKMLGCF